MKTDIAGRYSLENKDVGSGGVGDRKHDFRDVQHANTTTSLE